MADPEDSRFYSSLKLPLTIIIILWVIQGFQMLTHISLGTLGVYPRSSFGIKGIFLSPFIHSQEVMHLINNSVPLFISMAMVLFFYRSIAFKSIFLIYLLTGLGVWLFGRPVLHIGASGVVYGLVSFIFWNGMFRRNLKSIMLALIMILLYSGMFLGILPNQQGVSWESHLIGALVGIVVAFLFRRELEADEITTQHQYIEPENEGSFFLDRNTFAETKDERRQRSSDWFSDSTF